METPDLLEVLACEAGGQQLTLPSLFAPERTPGWSAVLRLSGESLVVRLPGQGSLYEGSMPTEQRWRRDVAATGDVVIITGPMAGPTCVDPAIHAGLTTHVRVKLSIRR